MKTSILLPEDQKYFSVQELRSKNLSQYEIRQLASRGQLKKLNKSHYENTAYHGEESDYYCVSAYAPNGVVCLLSAAAYYKLTNYIPDSIDVAIPRKSKISTLPEWPRLNVWYFTDERYSIGIQRIQEGKNGFPIYDIEKTIVDIVFYRERVGIEETKEILTTYLKHMDRNLNQLLDYSRAMKCEGVLRQYLEVLI